MNSPGVIFTNFDLKSWLSNLSNSFFERSALRVCGNGRVDERAPEDLGFVSSLEQENSVREKRK